MSRNEPGVPVQADTVAHTQAPVRGAVGVPVQARERARQIVASARRVTVLTGAGISTDSGIPEFRGPIGVWTLNPGAVKMFTLDNSLADPQIRRVAWQNRLHSPAWTAQPNAGHRALVELERSGRMRALVTQNIDGLHQRAGSTEDLVVEVHGTIWDVVCLDCGDRNPTSQALKRVEAGEDDPPCRLCGGILKSATISFGQNLEKPVFDRAVAAAEDCDVFLAVGTSLRVYPVAGLPQIAIGGRARLVIVNGEETPLDELAEVVVRDPISEVLPELVTSEG